MTAVASFVDGLKQSRSDSDAEAYGTLLDLAPDFLKDFARRDGLAVERCYREAITRAGDVRADRKTAPIVGSLLEELENPQFDKTRTATYESPQAWNLSVSQMGYTIH